MFDDRPQIKKRLDEAHVAWLTTVSPDGQPQPSLVWYITDDGSFIIYSRAGTPRERNIAANPRVALNLSSDDHGSAPLVVEGEARIVGREPRFTDDAVYYAKYQRLVADLGMTDDEFARDYPLRISVRPTRLRAS